IRHGQARLDHENYDQLSELGVVQSEVLGRWLATTRRLPGGVVCGTLDRHRQTANACLAAWGQATTASSPGCPFQRVRSPGGTGAPLAGIWRASRAERDACGGRKSA